MPQAITEMLAAKAEDRRSRPRVGVLESGLLYSDDNCIDCQIVDVSAGGARVRPVGPKPAEGGRCRFMLARLGLFEATVRWISNDSIGLSFEAPDAVVEERCAPLLAAAH